MFLVAIAGERGCWACFGRLDDVVSIASSSTLLGWGFLASSNEKP